MRLNTDCGELRPICYHCYCLQSNLDLKFSCHEQNSGVSYLQTRGDFYGMLQIGSASEYFSCEIDRLEKSSSMNYCSEEYASGDRTNLESEQLDYCFGYSS